MTFKYSEITYITLGLWLTVRYVFFLGVEEKDMFLFIDLLFNSIITL